MKTLVRRQLPTTDDIVSAIFGRVNTNNDFLPGGDFATSMTDLQSAFSLAAQLKCIATAWAAPMMSPMCRLDSTNCADVFSKSQSEVLPPEKHRKLRQRIDSRSLNAIM